MTPPQRPARHVSSEGDSGKSAQSREHLPSRQYTVKKQIVAGFVIFRRTADGIKFLLLYKRGDYWNFPKGHFEPGETSLSTALRETEEETGIKKNELRIVSGFRGYENFHFRAGNEKVYDTVILYLAETKKAQVTISTREHSGFGWFTYQDAIKTVGKKYGDTKKVLKQAHDFIYRTSYRRREAHPSGPHAHVS